MFNKLFQKYYEYNRDKAKYKLLSKSIQIFTTIGFTNELAF